MGIELGLTKFLQKMVQNIFGTQCVGTYDSGGLFLPWTTRAANLLYCELQHHKAPNNASRTEHLPDVWLNNDVSSLTVIVATVITPAVRVQTNCLNSAAL